MRPYCRSTRSRIPRSRRVSTGQEKEEKEKRKNAATGKRSPQRTAGACEEANRFAISCMSSDVRCSHPATQLPVPFAYKLIAATTVTSAYVRFLIPFDLSFNFALNSHSFFPFFLLTFSASSFIQVSFYCSFFACMLSVKITFTKSYLTPKPVYGITTRTTTTSTTNTNTPKPTTSDCVCDENEFLFDGTDGEGSGFFEFLFFSSILSL